MYLRMPRYSHAASMVAMPFHVLWKSGYRFLWAFGHRWLDEGLPRAVLSVMNSGMRVWSVCFCDSATAIGLIRFGIWWYPPGMHPSSGQWDYLCPNHNEDGGFKVTETPFDYTCPNIIWSSYPRKTHVRLEPPFDLINTRCFRSITLLYFSITIHIHISIWREVILSITTVLPIHIWCMETWIYTIPRASLQQAHHSTAILSITYMEATITYTEHTHLWHIHPFPYNTNQTAYRWVWYRWS